MASWRLLQAYTPVAAQWCAIKLLRYTRMWPHDEFSGIHSRGRMMSHIIVQPYECMPSHLYKSQRMSLSTSTQHELLRHTLTWPHDVAHHCAAIWVFCCVCLLLFRRVIKVHTHVAWWRVFQADTHMAAWHRTSLCGHMSVCLVHLLLFCRVVKVYSHVELLRYILMWPYAEVQTPSLKVKSFLYASTP